MLQKQFPVRLAYSMTLNKIQGQEAYNLLCDTRNAPFAIGHACVGFSIVRKVSSVAIIFNQKDILYKSCTVITNINILSYYVVFKHHF